ncbi:MAG: CrcB family protein [Thermoleophilia bacterium]
MTAWVWVGVAVCGAMGAVARFAVAQALAARTPATFPLGTFAVNSIGSFLAGVAAGAHLDGTARVVLVGGFLGAFTTFSTWVVEAHRVGHAHHRRATVVYVGTTLLAGLVAAGVGWALAALLL